MEMRVKHDRFSVVKSALAYLQLGRSVWVHLCQKKKKKSAITDTKSLRKIQVDCHKKQKSLLSDEEKKKRKKKAQTNIFERLNQHFLNC